MDHNALNCNNHQGNSGGHPPKYDDYPPVNRTNQYATMPVKPGGKNIFKMLNNENMMLNVRLQYMANFDL